MITFSCSLQLIACYIISPLKEFVNNVHSLISCLVLKHSLVLKHDYWYIPIHDYWYPHFMLSAEPWYEFSCLVLKHDYWYQFPCIMLHDPSKSVRQYGSLTKYLAINSWYEFSCLVLKHDYNVRSLISCLVPKHGLVLKHDYWYIPIVWKHDMNFHAYDSA